jgi:hypothetical protein
MQYVNSITNDYEKDISDEKNERRSNNKIECLENSTKIVTQTNPAKLFHREGRVFRSN